MLRPRLPRRSRVVLVFVALTALLGATAPAALASGGQGATTNPYSPAYGHPYRHGVVPTIAGLQQMQSWARSAGHSPFGSTSPLTYGGGIDRIGVTTGAEKVYLVFYGSQWGTVGTNGNGYTTLSGDPSGEAPYVQALVNGLGTNNELWSGVMTQYCQGISTGAQSCPTSNAYHVAYPTGGALAGVWVDESVASPSQATAAQLGQEAVNAAGHFGNATASANRDAQYVILSPTGTHPDGFNTPSGQFCAWHDWNGDSYVGVSSPYGDIAFTNMPYVTDMGTSCGQNFVNSGSAGNLDGVSIVEGHEYAETITDQNPAGGWTDSSGYENGDKCAWNSGPGAVAQNLSLTTGTFAMQPTWANDGSACEFSHSIVANGTANTITVTNPGSQTGTVGTATSLQIQATDSDATQTLTYGASGLPAGLSINSSTGLISGTPTTAATYTTTVTATDTTGASGQASFTWTINPSTTNTITVTDPGSQTGTVGTATSLQITATDSDATQTLTYGASGLPAGLSINSSTGLISGAPTTAATYTTTVTATDTTGASGQASFTWTINPTTTSTLSITTTSLPAAHIGRSYSTTLAASGGTGSYTWGLATGSALPNGFSLSQTTGTISTSDVSVPNAKYTFTVTVTDSAGQTASQTLTLNVVGH